MLGFVVLLTFILLARAFRSLVLPLKAVILNLVSLAAAYGIIVFIFQEGHGSEAIWNVHATQSIIPWIPLMIFAFLYGLSMDYEVFMLTRMREAYDETGDTKQAIALGLARTGKLVTSAALVLMFAFFVLSSGPGVDIKQFGIGLAAGIIFDATVIRALLVPALMRLLGRWNWWLPRPAAQGAVRRYRPTPSTMEVCTECPMTIVLVGTRKGASCSRATETAATGSCAARSATAGRSTTPCTTRPRRDLCGRGERVARRGRLAQQDLGETWELSSEGLAYDEDSGMKLSKVATLTAGTAACSRAPRRAGSSRAATAARPGRSSRRSTDSRTATSGTTRRTSRPGTWAARRSSSTRTRRRASGRSCRGTGSSRRRTAASRGRPATAGYAPTGRSTIPRSATACTSSCSRPDQQRMYQQNHCGMHRSDDAGAVLDGDHRGAAHRLRLRRGGAPARPRHVLRVPSIRATAAYARGPRGGLAHPRRRLELAAARRGAAAARRASRRAARGHGDRRATTSPGLYFGTSTGQVFASADEGESWSEIASYLPAISSVEVAVLE